MKRAHSSANKSNHSPLSPRRGGAGGERLSGGERLQGSEPLAWLLFYLFAFTWLALQSISWLRLTICPSRIFLHLPCPLCGLTRAFLLLLQGRVAEAVLMNPNIVLAVPFFATLPVLWCIDYFCGTSLWPRLKRRLLTPWTVALLALFELTVWLRALCGLSGDLV